MKLYYGNGKCSIEGFTERIAIIISYSGAIEIDDLTPDGYAIAAGSNKISIFPYQLTEAALGDLFNYIGTLKITKADITDTNGMVQTTVHKVMDYSELLNSNAEDMTTISEDLSVGYTSHRKIAKTILKQKIIPNLDTSDGALFYLPDDTVYSGAYHIHLTDSTAMTGGEHTNDSVLLKSKVIRKRRRKRTMAQHSSTASNVRIPPDMVGKKSGGSGGGY